jgi:hypothetical protein
MPTLTRAYTFLKRVANVAPGRMLILAMAPKILLQDATTHNFLRGVGVWTSSFDDALDFEEIPRALDYALIHELEKVRVVVKFSHRHDDVELPAVNTMAYVSAWCGPRAKQTQTEQGLKQLRRRASRVPSGQEHR